MMQTKHDQTKPEPTDKTATICGTDIGDALNYYFRIKLMYVIRI